MPEGVLRIYDPAECSADGKPLDWERCRPCHGDGYLLFNYGHTVEPDGSLGGRGMRSTPCEPCAGHGSLKAAALAHMRYGTCVDVGRLDASVGREPRCEDCGHPMGDGTWEDPTGIFAPEHHAEVLNGALEILRIGQEPLPIYPVHYSACDDGCRHAGPGRRWTLNPHRWLVGDIDWLRVQGEGMGVSVEASWRPVDIRTLGWPHDLRPERLEVLCFRCWAERTRPVSAGMA